MNILNEASPLPHDMRPLARIMATANQQQPVAPGEVWLVGAGPGDVELLTLKALRIIQLADVVVFDRLVSEDVMALVPPHTLQIDVGKSTRRHTMAQDEINQLLVSLAQSGHKVARIKGGDPFVFGRGGEELLHCQQHNVACHIVPGITAAMGCAAANGIPLTHRHVAHSVRFVAGHSAQGEPEPDWSALTATRQTLVFYMGIANCGRISKRLITHGLDPATKVAVISRGTQPDQRVIVGQLSQLKQMVVMHQIEAPALLIVGDVVNLYQQPNNYDIANLA
ncbi:uroporphyrinogen-III C-methyltransferase [Carnimonas bestiolae]|uniref:uroporphyrinogen-III C-methyltransferase n=1 Tax=Carnimonas bestiolae TaxID=3402172 RepID=UPI003EDBEE9C